MYFLEHIKKQFLASVVSYYEGDKLSAPEPIKKPKEKLEKGESEDNTAKKIELGNRARSLSEGLDAKINFAVDRMKAISEGKEGDKNQIIEMTSEQAIDNISLTPDEMMKTRSEMQGENGMNRDIEITDAQVKQKIFDQRKADQITNTLTVEEQKVTEAKYIEDLAKKHDISPELLSDLTVLGFEGSQDWKPEEKVQKLAELGGDLQKMKEKIEAQGGKFPQTKEEFLALWEVMNQNDSGKSNNEKVDPEAAAAMGVNVERTKDGFGINPNTEGYSQVGDSVIGPAGAPYSRNGEVFSGTGTVSKEVNANLDASYTGLKQNSLNSLSPEQEGKLKNKENKELIEKRIPKEWQEVAIKLCNIEGKPLNPAYPILISSMTEKRGMVAYPDGKVDEFPIIIGAGGFREGAHSGGKTTPTETVFHFNSNSKVTAKGQDASNGGSSTVIGASIQSPEGSVSGGKWWHGVADNRIPGGATNGCIGGKQENMMMAGRAVLQAGGGYGFNTKTKGGSIAGQGSTTVS